MNSYRYFYKIKPADRNLSDHYEMENNAKLFDLIGIDDTLGPAKHMLYFKKPESSSLPLDLNCRFDDHIFSKNMDAAGIFTKIEYIIMHRGAKNCNRRQLSVYTTRGVLNDIMTTPFSTTSFANWSIFATRYGNSIYVTENRDNSTRTFKKTDAYHFKFKQNCFSENPNMEPNADDPYDETHRIFGAYRRKLGKFMFTYTAEIDGVQSDESIKNLNNRIELNKMRIVSTKLIRLQKYSYWKKLPKLMKWWGQAYLAGVNDIYIGFRDEDGFINVPIRHVNVADIPIDQKWNTNSCICFLEKFFNMLASRMQDNCPYTVYEIQYNGEKKEIQYAIFKGKTDKTFLSDEFIAHIQKYK